MLCISSYESYRQCTKCHSSLFALYFMIVSPTAKVFIHLFATFTFSRSDRDIQSRSWRVYQRGDASHPCGSIRCNLFILFELTFISLMQYSFSSILVVKLSYVCKVYIKALSLVNKVMQHYFDKKVK